MMTLRYSSDCCLVYSSVILLPKLELIAFSSLFAFDRLLTFYSLLEYSTINLNMPCTALRFHEISRMQLEIDSIRNTRVYESIGDASAELFYGVFPSSKQHEGPASITLSMLEIAIGVRAKGTVNHVIIYSSSLIIFAAPSIASAASSAASSADSLSSWAFCSANAVRMLALILISSSLAPETLRFLRIEARLHDGDSQLNEYRFKRIDSPRRLFLEVFFRSIDDLLHYLEVLLRRLSSCSSQSKSFLVDAVLGVGGSHEEFAG